MAKNLTSMSGTSKKVPAKTRQTTKARKDQVRNNAGGYAFAIDGWARLNRFLILGSEGGTYYVSNRKLSQDNAKSVIDLIKKDGVRVVDTVVEISEAGRAPKNDPALFVLALCASVGNDDVRSYALHALPRVARIGTHLFTFAAFADSLRRWGTGLQKAIGRWYNDMDPRKLAYQVCKYASRRLEGELPWTHRDLLRKTHLKPADDKHNVIYRYVTKGREGFSVDEWDALKNDETLRYLWAHEAAKTADSESDIVKLIKEYNLSQESIPSKMKGEKVYNALLPGMPVTATMRNLGVLTSAGTLKPLSSNIKIVTDRLTDKETLKRGRVHPLSVLAALKTYGSGHGFRGSLSWKPVLQIRDALDDAFYASFDAVEPTGKRFLLGIDVSGSMSWSAPSGIDCLMCSEAAAAMAMTIARTESQYHIMGFSNQFVDLGITAKQKLETVISKVSNLTFGSTDCALPMIWAKEQNVDVDCFVVITDNETWAGNIHPFQALKQYRQKSGINAKLVVIAMTSSGFTIADPNDPGMYDVVGFDTATPNLISEFVRGSI